MASINIKLDFLVCETSINTFLCKFYYYDNVNSSIKPWTAQQSTKQDALALMQTYSNDLYTALQNKEGITPLGGGSVTDYGTFSEMSFDIVVDTGSQSQDIDYTQILTSINSNLASIASNSGTIASKDNQSNIVDCLKLIFVNRISGVESSVMKVNSTVDSIKQNSSIPLLLSRIAQFLSSDANFTWTSSNDLSYRALDNISKKLSLSTPTDTGALTNYSIKNILLALFKTISNTDYLNNASANSVLKQISDKLANANDLHTISQAIDLISTAIAQTPTTDTTNLEQGLTEIKESIESKDNVLLVDGTQNFVFRKEEEEE